MGPGHRAGMKWTLVSGMAVTVVTRCFDRGLWGVKGEPSHTQGGCPGERGTVVVLHPESCRTTCSH